jgi:hypothetical protein
MEQVYVFGGIVGILVAAYFLVRAINFMFKDK